MAYFRAAIGGGGGSVQKTTLWTNPSPTSNYDSGSASLSADMDNYDYLEFVFRISTSNSDEHSMLIPVSDFKTTETGTGAGKYKYAFSESNAGSTVIFRSFYYANDTSVTYGQCQQFRPNSSTVNQPTLAIPVYIKGVKI